MLTHKRGLCREKLRLDPVGSLAQTDPDTKLILHTGPNAPRSSGSYTTARDLNENPHRVRRPEMDTHFFRVRFVAQTP